MRWITGITLNNYRAFKGLYATISIPLNHHMFIYGENGSGKSSIYNAVRDFFQSSANTAKSFDVNLFSKSDGNDTGSIQLHITELDPNKKVTAENNFIFGKPDTQSNHRIPIIQLANKVKGFLDYKRMLQTHFVDTPDGQPPNLFPLVVEDLLADHLIKKTTGGGVADFELYTEWRRISEPILKFDRRYSAHKKALSELPLFEEALRQLLIQVFTEFKRLIQKYFDSKLDINVKLSQMIFDRKKKSIAQELYLDIKYAGVSIPSYQTFLNEARLSALALCIYFAALKTYPTIASDLKVLYLDDVFIGLDTSNRIPLLEILRDEFIKQDFQIFISTYDRQWFELARQWFDNNGCKFKSQELYIEDDGNPTTPEYPVVQPSEGNLKKAEAYFKAKDYPATGNYLRKECEAIIKNLLPDTYRIGNGGESITELEELIQQLNRLYEDSNIAKPQALIEALKIYRKALLNPSSHDDLKSPIYRREIQDAFNLVRQLQSLPKLNIRKVLDAGQKLSIHFPADSYSIEMELCDNLFVTEHNGSKVLSAAKYIIRKWTYRGVDYGKKDGTKITSMSQAEIEEITERKRSLDEIFFGINKSVGIKIPTDIISAVTIGTTGTLRDLVMS